MEKRVKCLETTVFAMAQLLTLEQKQRLMDDARRDEAEDMYPTIGVYNASMFIQQWRKMRPEATYEIRWIFEMFKAMSFRAQTHVVSKVDVPKQFQSVVAQRFNEVGDWRSEIVERFHPDVSFDLVRFDDCESDKTKTKWKTEAVKIVWRSPVVCLVREIVRYL